MLGLNWIVDGHSDDTPPGGALVFELWQATDGAYSVRVYYTAQTLQQMRQAQPLTSANPPVRVPVLCRVVEGGTGRARWMVSPPLYAAPWIQHTSTPSREVMHRGQ